MKRFPIGVLLDSFRLAPEEAMRRAAALGVKGVQVYATKGELAPENMDAAKRRMEDARATPDVHLEQEADQLNARCLTFGLMLIPLLYLPLSCAPDRVPAVGLPMLPDLTRVLLLNRFPADSPERLSLCWEVNRTLSRLEQELKKAEEIIKKVPSQDFSPARFLK